MLPGRIYEPCSSYSVMWQNDFHQLNQNRQCVNVKKLKGHCECLFHCSNFFLMLLFFYLVFFLQGTTCTWESVQNFLTCQPSRWCLQMPHKGFSTIINKNGYSHWCPTCTLCLRTRAEKKCAVLPLSCKRPLKTHPHVDASSPPQLLLLHYNSWPSLCSFVCGEH